MYIHSEEYMSLIYSMTLTTYPMREKKPQQIGNYLLDEITPKALKLEMAGLKGRGSLIKVCKAMGFKGGTKKKAYEWITKHIEEFKEADKYEVN